MLAPTGTSIVIDGDPRMRERPIADLADALKGLGAGIEYLGRPGCPPLRITPAADRAGLDDTITLGRAASSQFISALMMVAPFLPRGLTVRFIEAPSWPYIKMTEEMLREVGVRTHDDHGHAMRVWCGSRHSSGASGENGIGAFSMEIEPDASGATYFEAAAALIPGAGCIIDGLDLHPVSSSLQGDTRFISAITSAGARCERLKNSLRISGVATLAPLTIDLESMPDTAMTAAALACFASPTPDNPTATSMLRGLRTLRVKETDRLAALQTELRKLGAVVDIIKEGSDEGLRITPPLELRDRNESVVFDTYNDHRMAMSLALIGLRVPGVRINNPRCVAKTYPTFWQDLSRLYE
jgi:3-phosphoshikimate 1-carboxyvinyltransferase